MKKFKQLYVDGTFRICPRGYYQVLNIGGYYEDINGIVPVFLIPTTGKSEYLYNMIFNDVKKIIIDANINLSDIPKYIMADFEVGLQRALKTSFPNSLISGCFFHLVKCLWDRAKKYGLIKKESIKHTKILIFILKLIPYINIDEREDFFKKLEDFYSIKLNDNKYLKLIKYYRKNWITNSYINYTEISEEEYLFRTNNYLENFHHLLNASIEVYHPKVSYLIYKYKEYLIMIYQKVKESLVKDTKIEKKNLVLWMIF